jgi:hypothetical protein
MEHKLTTKGSFMIKQVMLACMVLAVAAGAVAQQMKQEGKRVDKVTVVITHEVKDYVAWKNVFDADDMDRSKAGFKLSGVYRDAKSPNWVTVVGEFPNVDAAESFVSNPKLKEIMGQGGVLGKPEVRFLTKVGM